MQVSKNRWVTVTNDPDATYPITIEPACLTSPTGPIRPQLGVDQPDHVDRLPHRTFKGIAPDFWWLGVHGGAGESSLARLEKNTQAAGHHWPQTPMGSTVVLVARSNMHGLRAAQRAATEWASGSLSKIHIAGLVVVADAPGKLPKAIREFALVVGGGVPHLWHIPWIEQWRMGHEVPYELLPKDMRAVLQEIRLAASQPAGFPAN